MISRAYYLTNNKKYLEAGNKILNFMITSAGRYLKDGTRKNLYDFANKYDEIRKYNSYYLFDTYIGIPSSYVLNGNLFALLGLYDWYRLGKADYGSNIAKINFDNGIKAIELLLPYYDYYGWSSYGLNQYTNNDYIGLGNRYAHRCHLQLLYILYTKTNSEKFKYYVDRFLDYYQDDFWIQSDIIYQNVPRIKLDNGNEIMDVDNYYINGTTTGNRVEVFLNNKLIDTIIPNQKRFSYKINKFLLNDGWNYINFISFNVNNNYSSSNGAMINNINNQPDTFIPEEYIKQARIINSKLRGKYLLYDDYEYDKNYIGAGKLVENNNTRFDDDGIPMVKKEDKWYYNPVSISTQALGLYKDYLANSSDVNKNAFLHVADYFVDNHEDGAFKYDIDFKFQNVELTKGWTSAMAEGRALSVLARAYKITNDKKYANAGKIVLNYMISSADEDLLKGTSKKLYDFTNKYEEIKKYNDYRIFEEYVSNPSSYVLNGDLFALVGLYDWSKAVSEEYGSMIAKEAFFDGIKSVEILLPYYDYYGWSSYDLLQYTNNYVPYLESTYAHRCHLQLLYILYEKTNSEKIKYYIDRFMDYYKDDFWSQKQIMYKD